MLRSMVEAKPESSDDYVVEHDGRVIGKAGCWRLPEVGFMIAFEKTGRGFASEAMSAFLDHRRRFASRVA